MRAIELEYHADQVGRNNKKMGQVMEELIKT